MEFFDLPTGPRDATGIQRTSHLSNIVTAQNSWAQSYTRFAFFFHLFCFFKFFLNQIHPKNSKNGDRLSTDSGPDELWCPEMVTIDLFSDFNPQ